jgi:hypothetical protein
VAKTSHGWLQRLSALIDDDVAVLAMWREATTGQHGGNRKSEKAKADQACNANLKYGTREHWLARLDRERPDLFAKVRAGELSANVAAVRSAGTW